MTEIKKQHNSENKDDKPDKENEEYEEVLESYYQNHLVKALIGVRVDTKRADKIAEKICGPDAVRDVFLVTGELDIIIKCIFQTYSELKQFLVNDVGSLDGVKETETMMVVTTFKEVGKKLID